MYFKAVADTDIGISKGVNQDSLMLKHAKCSLGEVLMAVVCDGMGGLDKGEVASAALIREFSRWFDDELPYEIEKAVKESALQRIGAEWAGLLRDMNGRLLNYGRYQNINMGTTFTGILFAGNQYVIAHVGDSRVYYIDSSLQQLTSDHTFVAREVRLGNMTLQQARNDKRKNMLLQCVGASENIEPEIIVGTGRKGVYMLCSDGFRNKLTEAELYGALNPSMLHGRNSMSSQAEYLIEQVKNRNEKDNISVILIKAG